MICWDQCFNQYYTSHLSFPFFLFLSSSLIFFYRFSHSTCSLFFFVPLPFFFIRCFLFLIHSFHFFADYQNSYTWRKHLNDILYFSGVFNDDCYEMSSGTENSAGLSVFFADLSLSRASHRSWLQLLPWLPLWSPLHGCNSER